jgi:hypothetical protein
MSELADAISEARRLVAEATPGPWVIVAEGIDGEDGIGGIMLGPTGVDQYGRPVGYDDFIETDGGHYGPRIPNARLIAKAPELAALAADMAETLYHGPNCASHKQRRDAPNVIRLTCDCGRDALLARFSALFGSEEA